MLKPLLALLLLLPACSTITCAQPISAISERDPATSIPVVTVRCGAQQIARQACYDGGLKRKTAKGWDILCDGDLLVSVEVTK